MFSEEGDDLRALRPVMLPLPPTSSSPEGVLVSLPLGIMETVAING